MNNINIEHEYSLNDHMIPLYITLLQHLESITVNNKTSLRFKVYTEQNNIIIKSNNIKLLENISKSLKLNKNFNVENIIGCGKECNDYLYMLKIIPILSVKNSLNFTKSSLNYSSSQDTDTIKRITKITPEVVIDIIDKSVFELQSKYKNIKVSSYIIDDILIIESNIKEILDYIVNEYILYPDNRLIENIYNLVCISLTPYKNILKFALSKNILNVFKEYTDYSILTYDINAKDDIGLTTIAKFLKNCYKDIDITDYYIDFGNIKLSNTISKYLKDLSNNNYDVDINISVMYKNNNIYIESNNQELINFLLNSSYSDICSVPIISIVKHTIHQEIPIFKLVILTHKINNYTKEDFNNKFYVKYVK